MERLVETIFCDDIRHEVGNKRSLIGVYSGQLLVSTMPAILPKLCVSVTVTTPIEKPFRKLVIRLLINDTEILRGDMGDNPVPPEDMQHTTALPDDVEHFYSLTADFVLSPFQINEPAALRVRVDTEDGTLKGHGLHLRLLSPET